MEKPIIIEWKYYQCTWTVVDNINVMEYVEKSNFDMWIGITFGFFMAFCTALIIRTRLQQ